MTIAEKFAKEGARVFIFARGKEEVDKSVKDLNRNIKTKSAYALVGDVSSLKDVRSAVRKVVSKTGGIDILVNCAGQQEPIGRFVEDDLNQWEKNISVNLLGTAYFCHEALPIMIKNKKGKIINFSGGGATNSRPNFSAYAVAKTGVVRLTEILSDEVGKYGIDINAIAPGAVNTHMLDEVIKAGERAGKRELEEAKKRVKDGGTPPELAADLAVLLASSKSNGLSGRIISAAWDNWKSWDREKIKEITKSEKYKLRRLI
ncbi:MAG: SDR family oxidoreductase [Patescibacteria group bacterium]|nr:SDR family oxidoreductase [Patescibacteria group bacterium]